LKARGSFDTAGGHHCHKNAHFHGEESSQLTFADLNQSIQLLEYSMEGQKSAALGPQSIHGSIELLSGVNDPKGATCTQWTTCPWGNYQATVFGYGSWTLDSSTAPSHIAGQQSHLPTPTHIIHQHVLRSGRIDTLVGHSIDSTNW